MHFRVPHLEDDEQPARVGRPDAQEDDTDESRDKADCCHGVGEGQHAIADDLGDHEYGDELPRQGLVLDLQKRCCSAPPTLHAVFGTSCILTFAHIMVFLMSKDIVVVIVF